MDWFKTLGIIAGVFIIIYQCFGISGLKKAGITFLVILLILCIAIWFLQNNLLYMPGTSHYIQSSPDLQNHREKTILDIGTRPIIIRIGKQSMFALTQEMGRLFRVG